MFNKPTASIILNGERLKEFSLRSGIGLECPLSPLLLNIELEVLARAIGCEINKGHQNWKKVSQITPVSI